MLIFLKDQNPQEKDEDAEGKDEDAQGILLGRHLDLPANTTRENNFSTLR
jgi:hypothetical protein